MTPRWLIATTVLLGHAAGAADLKVLSTRATEEIYRELAPQFEWVSGHRLATTFTGTLDVRNRIAAGERCDVVIIIDTVIDDLIRTGQVIPGSRVDIATSSIGIGLHAGLPKPAVGSAAALRETLLAARSIGYSTGPSGAVVLDMLRKMSIADAVAPKLRQPPSGVLVGAVIAGGEADIGFQQVNELSHFPGVDYLGLLPAEFQDVTRRSGAVMVGTAEPAAAAQLLAFLAGPGAAAVIRRHGLEPAGPVSSGAGTRTREGAGHPP